jgi:N-acetylated-alpha-linked acidic dipeptidase
LPVAYPLARGPSRVHLVVELSRAKKTLWNTIGRIRGSRGGQSVMLGAHRDAWVAGVGDNGAGIMTMLEMARGLGYLAKSGWHPQRTIIVAGWDGEEIGLVGSTAFVKRHAVELNRDCIAYLNADENLTGSTFGAEAAAAIGSSITDATRAVEDPAADRAAVYERWSKQISARDPNAPRPNLGNPGGGSDHEPFLFDAGIPVASMGFNGPYGVYHSSYDTLRYATTYSDPGFIFHRTAAQLYGIAAMRLADASVIPYTYSNYLPLLRTGYKTIEARAQREHLDIDLATLHSAIDAFALAATRMDARIAAATQPEFADRELSAVHDLDSLVYGRNGYASVAFPTINAAFVSGSAASVNAALQQAAGLVARATASVSV